jgi:hypothetical protein
MKIYVMKYNLFRHLLLLTHETNKKIIVRFYERISLCAISSPFFSLRFRQAHENKSWVYVRLLGVRFFFLQQKKHCWIQASERYFTATQYVTLLRAIRLCTTFKVIVYIHSVSRHIIILCFTSTILHTLYL